MNEFRAVSMEEMEQVEGGNALLELAGGITSALKGIDTLIGKGVDLLTTPRPSFPPSGWPNPKTY